MAKKGRNGLDRQCLDFSIVSYPRSLGISKAKKRESASS